MGKPGWEYTATTGYRYGFNGKENDNEVKGNGNQQDYGMRIYDPRLGKFLSIDPLFKDYPWYTPYQFAGNKPIEAVDLDGEEEYYVNQQSRVKHLYHSIHEAEEKVAPKIRQLNEIIAVSDIYGNGHIGPSYIVKQKLGRIRTEYVNAVGENIRGGIFGLIGYMLDGDRGSFTGAGLDNAIAAGTVLKPTLKNINVSTPKSPTTISEKSGVNLIVKAKPEWTTSQLDEAIVKVNELSSSKTIYTKNPAQRDANLRSKFKKAGGIIGNNQALDHIIDLQLGGTNKFNNLNGLDNSVNSSIGKQLQLQLRNLPDNTKINRVQLVRPYKR